MTRFSQCWHLVSNLRNGGGGFTVRQLASLTKHLQNDRQIIATPNFKYSETDDDTSRRNGVSPNRVAAQPPAGNKNRTLAFGERRRNQDDDAATKVKSNYSHLPTVDEKASNYVSGDLMQFEDKSKKRLIVKKRDTRDSESTQFQTRPKLTSVEGQIVFGIHPVLLAIKANRRSFHKLYLIRQRPGNSLNPRLKDVETIAADKGLLVEGVTRNLLDALSQGRPHQGVCLDATQLEPREWEWNDNDSQANMEQDVITRPPVWLLLDQIHDPMNLGAILRTAYYFAVERLIITKGRSCPLSPVVSKASSGALEVAPLYSIDCVESFLKEASCRGMDIVGTSCRTENSTPQEQPAHRNVLEHAIVKPTVLVIGNEGYGLDSSIRQLCSTLVTVFPGQQRSEQIDALNVSVATGIILHSLLSK